MTKSSKPKEKNSQYFSSASDSDSEDEKEDSDDEEEKEAEKVCIHIFFIRNPFFDLSLNFFSNMPEYLLLEI